MSRTESDPAAAKKSARPDRKRKHRRGRHSGRKHTSRSQEPRHFPKIPRYVRHLKRSWTEAKEWARRNPGAQPVLPFFGQQNPFPCSNHADAPFRYRGHLFPTSEHAYLAAQARALGFSDLARIWTQAKGRHFAYGRWYDASNPKAVKSWSTAAFKQMKRINHPLVRKWEADKTPIMFRILMAKFNGNREARRALLATGSQYLVEASPYDQCWGAGMGGTPRDFERALERGRLPGRNRLGMLLMAVRRVCRKNNFGLAALRSRTKNRLARRHVARDRTIPPNRRKQMATTTAHFIAQFIPGIAARVERARKLRAVTFTNGALDFPVARRTRPNWDQTARPTERAARH